MASGMTLPLPHSYLNGMQWYWHLKVVFKYLHLKLHSLYIITCNKLLLCDLLKSFPMSWMYVFIPLHHHQQWHFTPIPQGPPSVSFAVHEAAVHPLVLGPCWGHWCNGFGGPGQTPQEPALQAHRHQYARLHSAGKLTGCLFRIGCWCKTQDNNIVWIVFKSVCEWDCYSLHVLI